MLTEETLLHKQGYQFIAGVDEVGRGPLAGPVTAAAVILPPDFYHSDITDSKKMTAKMREAMYDYIVEHALSWSVVSVTPRVIDQINILQASKRAMRQAVKKLDPLPDFILLDAVNIQLPGIAQKAIIGGDAKVLSIAAASIVAKVTRDRLMLKLHKKYPQYGFDSHVGYPTPKHLEVLRAIGPTPVHRKSFAPVLELL